MSLRASATAIAGAACMALAVGGCTSISLRASEARMPILLGPVACIGCAPEADRGAAPPTVAGGVRERELVLAVFGPVYGDRLTRDGAPLDVAATQAVSDPCHEDIRVASIQAGAWAFYVPLIFGIVNAWVDVQASRAAVANGVCGPTPWPSAGPQGIVNAAAETSRDGRRP